MKAVQFLARHIFARHMVIAVSFMITSVHNADAQSQPTIQAQHSICAGRIYDVKLRKELPMGAFFLEASKATGVMMGERHGVAAHSEAAACFLRQMAQARAPRVVLEHLRADQQGIVDEYRAAHPEDSGGLGAKLKWWETGWPRWKNYMPLFQAIWDVKAPVLAGDEAKGTKAPDASNVETRLGEGSKAIILSWAASIKAAQCDMVDMERAKELALGQIGRDMEMAKQFHIAGSISNTQQNALSASGNVAGQGKNVPDTPLNLQRDKSRDTQSDKQPLPFLYAGRAHVRQDRSVPLVARKITLAPRAMAVALFEKQDLKGAIDVEKNLTEAQGAYDYLWFVGEVSEPDTCSKLRDKALLPAK